MFRPHILTILAFSITLTACEISVVQKDKADALFQGDLLSMQGVGDQAAAMKAYKEALGSKSPDIQGQAAYQLAQIALGQGQKANYRTYLEQAAAQGHIPAQLALADLVVASGDRQHYQSARDFYQSQAATFAGANLGLMRLAVKEGRHDELNHYADQAKKLLADQIGYGDDLDGNKSAMLARLYAAHDFPLIPDYKKAEYWYRQAIGKGHAKSAQELADLWLKLAQRPGVKVDAFSLMQQSAQAGNEGAIKYVAQAYEKGIGVRRDPSAALQWYEKLTTKKNRSSELYIGYGYLEGALAKQDPVKALAAFRSAAAQGAVEAMLIVDGLTNGTTYQSHYRKTPPASLHAKVKEIEQRIGQHHPEMVHRLYEIAGNAGAGKSAFRVAEDYARGFGVPADETQARQWYEKAAQLGHGPSLLMLARQAAVTSRAPTKEGAMPEFLQWYEKAAEAGEAEGQYNLGIAYARGEGVPKDIEKARYWLEKAQAGGYSLAIKVLESFTQEQKK